MAEGGFPISPGELRKYAQAFHMANTSNPDSTISAQWVSAFLYRHSDLKKAFSRSLDHSRAKASNPALIQDYFRLVEATIAKYNITANNIYNMDETGFALGQTTSRSVILPRKQLTAFHTQPGSWENVTVIKCIGAGGHSPPPMVILKGKHHLVGWYAKSKLPKDWIFAVSDNGWTDNDLGHQWLQHFNTSTKPSSSGAFRLLLLDGHTSHVSPEFVTSALDNNIIPLCLLPHSTHLVQPLDVSIFGPLTHAFRDQVDRLAQHGLSVDKGTFLQLYAECRAKVFTSRAQWKAFEDVGIGHSGQIDALKVLQRLPTFRGATTPPPSSASTEVFSEGHIPTMPKSAREASTLAAAIQQALQPEHDVHSSFKKLLKAATGALNKIVILREQNEDLQRALAKKRVWQRGNQAHLSKARVLTQVEVDEALARHLESPRKQGKQRAMDPPPTVTTSDDLEQTQASQIVEGMSMVPSGLAPEPIAPAVDPHLTLAGWSDWDMSGTAGPSGTVSLI